MVCFHTIVRFLKCAVPLVPFVLREETVAKMVPDRAHSCPNLPEVASNRSTGSTSSLRRGCLERPSFRSLDLCRRVWSWATSSPCTSRLPGNARRTGSSWPRLSVRRAWRWARGSCEDPRVDLAKRKSLFWSFCFRPSGKCSESGTGTARNFRPPSPPERRRRRVRRSRGRRFGGLGWPRLGVTRTPPMWETSREASQLEKLERNIATQVYYNGSSQKWPMPSSKRNDRGINTTKKVVVK